MINKGKQEIILVGAHRYSRLPIKTHLITSSDDIVTVCRQYAGASLRRGDMLFISERIVAICQGRAFPISQIHPSTLAKALSKFVHKSPYGIGLGSPWTMELAIREVGIFRILFGAFVAAITKPLGFKGVFYRVVGNNINAIDGPCDYTLAPYNQYAKLGPVMPDQVALDIRNATGNESVIIDANDLGVAVLGKSNKQTTNTFCKAVFRDNPLGQSNEQTPLCIVRMID